MDIRDLARGCELFLPVEAAGALFSVGDTHAAQGDGEVCGTAIESPMSVALKFDLIKQTPLSFPRFTTPGPVTRHLDAQGYEVCTGIGPDLMEAAVHALIEAQERRLEVYAGHAANAQSIIEDMHKSTSWRVTAPVRLLSRMLARRAPSTRAQPEN